MGEHAVPLLARGFEPKKRDPVEINLENASIRVVLMQTEEFTLGVAPRRLAVEIQGAAVPGNHGDGVPVKTLAGPDGLKYDDRLGLPSESGAVTPLVDILHRLLWLVDHRSSKVAEFLMAARPDKEKLKLVAQALAGRALSGGDVSEGNGGARSVEQKAIDRLLAAWRRVVEEAKFMQAQ